MDRPDVGTRPSPERLVEEVLKLRAKVREAESALAKAQQEIACICTEYDGKGYSVCGMVCAVHRREAVAQAERRAYERAAEIVEARGGCRLVDHVQDFCACRSKAAKIRALSAQPSGAGQVPDDRDALRRAVEDAHALLLLINVWLDENGTLRKDSAYHRKIKAALAKGQPQETKGK